MTLQDAKKIRSLLNLRDHFDGRLSETEKSFVVHGEVCTEGGGHPFRWENEKSREIEYLIKGYKEDIEKIDAIICSLPSTSLPEEPTEVCGYYV